MVEKSSASGSTSSLTHPGMAEPRSFFFLRHASPTVSAILVDAAFYLKRARRIFGDQSPQEAARRLHSIALDHLNDGNSRHRIARLYRVFVYDAPPVAWKGHTPIRKDAVDFSRSATAQWRIAFHEELRGQRKIALRLGEIPTQSVHWQLKRSVVKELANGRRHWEEISDEDFCLDLRQKGVDMRLGLDIAALAYKRQVNQIVLISGDADFVPAAKLARREGIDFILDPMWATIRPDLYEHVDGLRSVCPRP
ncbi:NYN domain-containing protein [Ectothiorhodospira mobilis]|uniref:NYN domain-containing protein n=1 Tax=Ectothiorhodospira mobilis TaxID=195064 RepID=A0A1I4SEV2_ECTMO|nr:NYN domain-containing protein [Ectothiorhodospira mobilis]MCG5534761.1 NYN domain-containing protein [Ectothiorhodospira mobilis]SFM63006.1 NYN domain-containing protein [Ectothiorhodospira mobilis]